MSTKSLEDLAEKTEIPLAIFKVALGIPLGEVCSATTPAEAEEAYRKAPNWSASGQAALIRWKELSATEVKEAQTLADAKHAYEVSPDDGGVELDALRKMYEIYMAG